MKKKMALGAIDACEKIGVTEPNVPVFFGSIIFLMGLAPNVLGYRHPTAILDRQYLEFMFNTTLTTF